MYKYKLFSIQERQFLRLESNPKTGMASKLGHRDMPYAVHYKQKNFRKGESREVFLAGLSVPFRQNNSQFTWHCLFSPCYSTSPEKVFQVYLHSVTFLKKDGSFNNSVSFSSFRRQCAPQFFLKVAKLKCEVDTANKSFRYAFLLYRWRRRKYMAVL